jgi:hypothetical protein
MVGHVQNMTMIIIFYVLNDEDHVITNEMNENQTYTSFNFTCIKSQ